MGVMGLGNGLPRPIEDTEQRTVVEIPEECGRCGSQAISFNRDIQQRGLPRRVSCFTCGWDAYLVLPSEAPVVGEIEIERQLRGRRTAIKADAPPVRSARPRGGVDRRKHRTIMPEPPPKYEYKPEAPTKFRPNGGHEILLPPEETA